MSIRASKLCALLFVTGVFAATAVRAEEQARLVDYDGTFEDATFAVESALLDAGLVIDHVSHTGDMLARTRADMGSDVVLFDGANVFLFCSAAISRQVMEADPMNVVHCPYSIFVIDRGGDVQIGHPLYRADSMDPVETLLSDLVDEAAAF